MMNVAESTRIVDVVVVGAGPAGATAALFLARGGVKVVLIEKEKLPREKVCGGGVQSRTLSQLPFSFQEVVEVECSGMVFTRELQHGFVRRSQSPIVYQVSRARFDNFLAQKAAAAGARVLDGLAVSSVEVEGSTCSVKTSSGDTFNSQFVVFADGVTSIGHRLLNPQESRFLQLGMECDVPLVSKVGRYDTTLVAVDWGTMPDGYAWIFPKKDHLVVGCGGPRNQTQSLKAYLSALTRRLGYEESECQNLRAHPIPSLTGKTIVANQRYILAGDAGGFVEPFSGEGISYAIKSGSGAAEAIIKTLTGQETLPDAYLSRVRNSLIKEILNLRKMKEYFALVPSHVHRLFRKNDRVWDEFCKALYGNAPATVVRDKAPFAFLWPVFDVFASIAYQRFLKRKITIGPKYFEEILARAQEEPYLGILNSNGASSCIDVINAKSTRGATAIG